MKGNTLILIAATLTIVGCSRENAAFTIGANLPLSGTVAYYGVSAQKGIELALDDLKMRREYKDHPMRVIFEDNQGQAKQAVTAMSKLVHADKVPAIIGGGTSTETMAAAPIANENKVVLISPISSASSISGAGPFVFRTCPSDKTQAEDLGEWVTQEGLSKLAIIYANSTWGNGFKNDLVAYLQNHSGEVVAVESSDPGDLNFRAQISVIKAANCDALIYVTYAKEGGAAVRQTREMGLKQPIFGADPWSQEDFRTGGGVAAEGVRYTTPVQYDGPTFREFRDAFLHKYNAEPDVYASNGYDCMMLLASAYAQGARSGPDFQARLCAVTDFNGATGMTHFDSNGDVIGKKFGRFIVVSGEPTLIR